MKVLVIDDHAFQRKFIARILKMSGLTDIHCATNGIEALDLMNKHGHDLLICDLNMPKMDGISLLSHVVKNGFKPNVIILSASNNLVLSSVEKMCKNYAIRLLGILPKPLTTDNLMKLINNIPSINQWKDVEADIKMKLSKDDISQAFSENWFTPYFQPIVELSTSNIFGYEMLSRMSHPNLGVITPYYYIDTLIEMEMDVNLVIFHINYIVKNIDRFKNVMVAINITPQALISDIFTKYFYMLLVEYPLIMSTIYFEITESQVIIDSGKTLEVVSKLCMKGVKLSIDDFGTGYSSFKLLETLPFESLKLDMSFIQAILTSNTAAAIIESCLQLSQRLSITTIAEGVEDYNVWLKLQEMQCPLAQGYFIARPMPLGAADF